MLGKRERFDLYFYSMFLLGITMSLSKTREKRANAGNRMAKILDAEDEDEFYKTTYGGFDEV